MLEMNLESIDPFLFHNSWMVQFCSCEDPENECDEHQNNGCFHSVLLVPYLRASISVRFS